MAPSRQARGLSGHIMTHFDLHEKNMHFVMIKVLDKIYVSLEHLFAIFPMPFSNIHKEALHATV